MFWLNNPRVLIESNRILPSNSMSYDDKLNSIARFALIFLILIYFLNGDMKWMSFSVTLLVLTILLRTNKEKFENLGCMNVSKDNPFGNFTLGDYISNVNRPEVCNTSLEKSESLIKEGFNGLLKEDYYQKNINFRDFYTLPVTKVVNDQTKFAKFLLGSSGECKHDGNNCLKNEDTKFHRGRFFNGN